MTPPPPKQTERGAETRQRILDAATDLFINRGYVTTPVSAIMTAGGVTKGGFYFHFPSKAMLGTEVARSACTAQQAMAMGAVDPSLSPFETLVALPHAVAAASVESPSMVLLGRLCLELRAEPDAEDVDPFAFWFTAVEDLVRASQADGDLDPALDPAMTAYRLVTSYVGSEYIECLRGGERTINPHVDDYVVFALRGMGVDPAVVASLEKEPNPAKGAD